MIMDIFFVNKIPLLIKLSLKIDFMATSNFPTHKYRGTLKYFLRIYVLYLRRGFKITTVNADGEFAPV